MLFEIIVAVAVAIAVFVLVWLLRGIVLTPVPAGKNMDIKVVVSVSGESPELEATVEALTWLKKNGTLPAEIIVRDEGMDDETAKTAYLMARSGKILLC